MRMRTYHSGESGISIGMGRNLDQLQQDMPHDYCHRFGGQGLRGRDVSGLTDQKCYSGTAHLLSFPHVGSQQKLLSIS
jgi:hypothetical protein